MSTSQSQKRSHRQAAEAGALIACGPWRRIVGNACSPIVLVKGDLTRPSVRVASLPPARMARRCARRLEPSATRPRIFACWQASPAWVTERSRGRDSPCELFREALEALDPEAVLLLDNNAADAMRETYADMLVAIDDFDTAMLQARPGRPCRAAACSRSTALKRHSPTRPLSSVCGPTSSADSGGRAAVAKPAPTNNDLERASRTRGTLNPSCPPLTSQRAAQTDAVNAELAVAVHAFDGKLNALGSKAVPGVRGYRQMSTMRGARSNVLETNSSS